MATSTVDSANHIASPVAARPDFKAVKFRANGMLDPAVYERLWQVAQTVDADVLEIGTAHGAATIAVALGLSSGRRIKTVDRLVGGSRARYGDARANEKIILENFRRFEVAPRIDLFIGDSLGMARTLADETRFGMLILDADGMIDRDLRIFWKYLDIGAHLVIDDVKMNGVRILVNSARQAKLDQKQKLSHLLVHHLEKKGAIKKIEKINDTWFGIKNTKKT